MKLGTLLALPLLVTMMLTAAPVAYGQFPADVNNDAGAFALTTKSLPEAVQDIVNVFLTLVAIAAVIVIVYAGVRYIISLGEEDEAARAKRMILYAVIGLIVVGLSAAVVNFVLGAIPR